MIIIIMILIHKNINCKIKIYNDYHCPVFFASYNFSIAKSANYFFFFFFVYILNAMT